MNAISSSEVLVLGGYSTDTDWNNRTFTYNAAANSWLENDAATGTIPAGLMLHSAVYHAVSHSVYTHGGYRYYIDEFFPTNETFFYSIAEHRWYKRPNTLQQPEGRYRHAATLFNDSMVIVGGLDADYMPNPSVWVYSFACDTWHELTGKAPLFRPRSYASVAMLFVFILADVQVKDTEPAVITIGSELVLIRKMNANPVVQVFRMPGDMCSLYSGGSTESCTSIRGCHACMDGSDVICFDKSLPAPASSVYQSPSDINP